MNTKEKEELLELLRDFYEHIEWFNKWRKQPLEEDIEPTFDNFYNWLAFEVQKEKQNI